MTDGPVRIRADVRSRSGTRNGQAMVETVVVMFFLCLVFFLGYEYANLFTAHTVVNYAAARAARARAVGFNDFMCTKAARVSVIPVSGKRLWPAEDGSLSASEELARVRTYLESPDGARARGLLEYEGWGRLGVNPGDGGQSVVTLSVEGVRLEGRAGVEAGASYYMTGGL